MCVGACAPHEQERMPARSPLPACGHRVGNSAAPTHRAGGGPPGPRPLGMPHRAPQVTLTSLPGGKRWFSRGSSGQQQARRRAHGCARRPGAPRRSAGAGAGRRPERGALPGPRGRCVAPASSLLETGACVEWPLQARQSLSSACPRGASSPEAARFQEGPLARGLWGPRGSACNGDESTGMPRASGRQRDTEPHSAEPSSPALGGRGGWWRRCVQGAEGLGRS